MKVFAVGDIHGACRALVQCLERSSFNPQTDHLIVLGDVADRYPETKECVDVLLDLPHCTMIMGNHDYWLLDWMQSGVSDSVWVNQGGQETKDSYREGIPESHIHFLQEALPYIVIEQRIFVHGGFNPSLPITDQNPESLSWDRNLIQSAYQQSLIDQNYQFSEYSEIFVGHTPTLLFEKTEPIRFCNLWDLDTGCGKGKKLTIMNVETKEYWQSDSAKKLYRE